MHTPELARRLVQARVRQGAIDQQMARFQLAAIDVAARSGQPVLVVEDVSPDEPKQPLVHAA
jgi:hypothetical protein